MKFEFTEQETNLILASLAKQPFEVVFSIIGNIQQQAIKQTKGEENVSDSAGISGSTNTSPTPA